MNEITDNSHQSRREQLQALARTNPVRAFYRVLLCAPDLELITASEFAELLRKVDSKSLLENRSFFTDSIGSERIAACASITPGNTLLAYASELTDEQFFDCVHRAPQEALRNHVSRARLTHEQLDFCIEMAPAEALWQVRTQLSDEQKQKCVERAPRAAMAVFGSRLSPENFDRCVRAEPGFALREGIVERLSREQLLFCLDSSPAEALRNKVAERLSPSLFASCVANAPRAALEHVADRLSHHQFTMCLDVVSDADLVMLILKLAPVEFSYCIEIDPDPKSYLEGKELTNKQRETLRNLIEDSTRNPTPDKSTISGEAAPQKPSSWDEQLRTFAESGGMDAMMETAELGEDHIDSQIIRLKMGLSLNTQMSLLKIGIVLLNTPIFGLFTLASPAKDAKMFSSLSTGRLIIPLFTREKHALAWLKSNPEQGFKFAEPVRVADLLNMLKDYPTDKSVDIQLNEGSGPYEVLLPKQIVDNVYNILFYGRDAVQRIMGVTGSLPTKRIKSVAG